MRTEPFICEEMYPAPPGQYGRHISSLTVLVLVHATELTGVQEVPDEWCKKVFSSQLPDE